MDKLDAIEIKVHAQAVADRGGDASESPYDSYSDAGQLWLNYFYGRVRWLSGEESA